MALLATPLLSASRLLLERAAAFHAPGIKLECKDFLNGAAAYANRRIFMMSTASGLALKLSPAAQAALIEKGAKPLHLLSGGPVKKGYVLLPKAIMGDLDALIPLLTESILFSQTVARARRARLSASGSK